jgi:hypothetical protein
VYRGRGAVLRGPFKRVQVSGGKWNLDDKFIEIVFGLCFGKTVEVLVRVFSLLSNSRIHLRHRSQRAV